MATAIFEKFAPATEITTTTPLRSNRLHGNAFHTAAHRELDLPPRGAERHTGTSGRLRAARPRLLTGFFIGRYDIRYANEEDLRAGKNFQIIELNGADSSIIFCLSWLVCVRFFECQRRFLSRIRSWCFWYERREISRDRSRFFWRQRSCDSRGRLFRSIRSCSSGVFVFEGAKVFSRMPARGHPPCVILRKSRIRWGGRRDLNPRQPDPQSGALTRLSYDHQPTRAKLIFFARSVKLRAGAWARSRAVPRSSKGAGRYAEHRKPLFYGIPPQPSP